MPRPPAFDVRTAEIDVKTAGTEKSPLLLERVAPKGPGVEGTRCDFRTARKYDTPHIRQP